MVTKENELKILLVDDIDPVRQSISDALILDGFEVVEARDGAEALKSLENERFSAVITDLWMPEIDGVELLSRLRKLAPNLPVIAITGGFSGRAPINYSLALATAVGADAVFKKPFDNDKLIETLKELLGLSD